MKAIARHGAHRLRSHAREVWESRGGGFYGFVAMLTFLYLEALNLAGDLVGLTHAHLDIGAIISWLVQNVVQAIMNVFWAAIWPVEWISHFGVGLTSAVLLASAYLSYRLLRPSVLRLLQEPEEPAGP